MFKNLKFTEDIISNSKASSLNSFLNSVYHVSYPMCSPLPASSVYSNYSVTLQELSKTINFLLHLGTAGITFFAGCLFTTVHALFTQKAIQVHHLLSKIPKNRAPKTKNFFPGCCLPTKAHVWHQTWSEIIQVNPTCRIARSAVVLPNCAAFQRNRQKY